MTAKGKRYTLGQLGKRVGLARSSLLHYERIGLLHPCLRSPAGYRLYGEIELQRLGTIRQLRDAGLSLSDIKTLLATEAAYASGITQRPGALLQRRLLDTCQTLDRIRQQQRQLARLLALPAFRDAAQGFDKSSWVAMLREAGFDDADMRDWHAGFEREDPAGHQAFLLSLGLTALEVESIRSDARSGMAIDA